MRNGARMQVNSCYRARPPPCRAENSPVTLTAYKSGGVAVVFAAGISVCTDSFVILSPSMLIRLPALLLALLPGLLAAADDPLELPELGADSGAILSIQEEEKIGAAFLRALRRDAAIIDDPVIDSYVQSLGTRLANHSDNTRYNFRFFVKRDPSINAVTLPAGIIYLHSGLIEAVTSESELASVVGHEIAHATQFHIHRAVDQDRRSSVPMTAALITALLLGVENPQAAELLLAATMAGKVQSDLNYSRLQEQEADRVGIRMLANAGFDPRAMPDFFETLHRQARVSESAMPEFLRTHPITESRISDSRNRAEQYPRSRIYDSEEFLLTKTHLHVLTAGDPRALAAEYRRSLKSDPKRRHLHYGLAMSLNRAGDYAAAEKTITRLLKTDQERLPYLLLRADISEKRGKLREARAHLTDTTALYPDNPWVITALARVLLALNQPQQARATLRDYLSLPRDNAAIYKLLGQAEEQSGHHGAAYEALARHHFLEGRPVYAVEHLRQALKQTDLSELDRSRVAQTMRDYQEAYRLEKQAREDEESKHDPGREPWTL